jgi:hypothetical protein
MEISKNAQYQLAELRRARDEKEAWWGEKALREIGKLLGRRIMLEIATEQLNLFLPEVETYNLDMNWVDEWLKMAQQFDPTSYKSIEDKLEDQESFLPNPSNAHEAITRYFREALKQLNWEFQDYFADNRQGKSYGGIASYFGWLFRSQLAIYQDLHCPELYAEYMEILNLEDSLGFRRSDLSQEIAMKYAAIQKAWLTCRSEAPYTFWLNLADDIEKRLAQSTTVP